MKWYVAPAGKPVRSAVAIVWSSDETGSNSGRTHLLNLDPGTMAATMPRVLEATADRDRQLHELRAAVAELGRGVGPDAYKLATYTYGAMLDRVGGSWLSWRLTRAGRRG